MNDPENEGLLSSLAEWRLGVWRSGFTDNLFDRLDLESNYRAHAAELMRWVNRTDEVAANLDRAIEATVAFCDGDQIRPDHDEFERRKSSGLAALDELKRACRRAGLSAEARALGA